MALAAAQAGIWEWHLDTNVKIWSDEVWLLYGLASHQEASYDNWLYSIHPDDRTYARQTVTAASQCRVPFEIEWRTNPETGPVRWLMSRGQPGKPRGEGQPTYTGIVMDITARKRAEHAVLKLTETLEERVRERTAALSEHERLLQNILDGIPGPIGYWTKELHNRFANKAYSDWFGKTPEQIRHCHIREVLGADLLELNWHYIQAALRGKRQRFERQIVTPGQPDKPRHTETHYLPDVRNDEVLGFLVIVFDVSQIKEAELAAEAANVAKSELLANISHEVRTPLNAMFGLAQVGARQSAGSPIARTFEQILDSAQHLLSLVNDVLDFSKIESGKLTLLYERFNLGQVLDHVLTLKSILAQAKGLRLSLTESATVPRYAHGDATRIAQILLNLLSNAIKFTEHGGIDIRIDYQAPMLSIEVSDSGMGMSAEKLAQLFRPFVQVHGNHPAQAGGTGLGLAITKRLTNMMKGQIDVVSQAGQGSTFTAKLPLMHPEYLDVSPLGHVALIGLSPTDCDNLSTSLLARRCKVTEHSGIAAANGTPARVFVIAADIVNDDAVEPLKSWLASDCTVIINSQTSAALDIPCELHKDLVVAVGPMSPLRLINALKSRQQVQPVHASHRLRGIRVLAAEDNPVNRLVLGQLLEQEGAIVTFAFDGAHALEQVRVHGPASFDIVLCDIQMPVMDGYQTAQALGRIAPSLPVIGLTAHAFDSAKQQARQAGMVGYITKPYMLDTLVDETRRYARRRPGEAQPALTDTVTDGASPTSGHNMPQQQDITDWQAMQQYFQSQPQLLDRLIGMLSGTLSEIQAELKQAMADSDMNNLAKVAHNIKGTALNLHTPELARLAVQTQEEARQKNPGTLVTAQMLAMRLEAFIDMAAQHQSKQAN